MSGGSLNYVFCQIENNLCGQMEDAELNDLMLDIGKLAHDLEWWKSGDTSEKEYRKTVKAFKAKWFEADRNKRIEKYVKEAIASKDGKKWVICICAIKNGKKLDVMKMRDTLMLEYD